MPEAETDQSSHPVQHTQVYPALKMGKHEEFNIKYELNKSSVFFAFHLILHKLNIPLFGEGYVFLGAVFI